MACVFLLEAVQWCRKNLDYSCKLEQFVALVGQNLLRLKWGGGNSDELTRILEKEISVVNSLKKKVRSQVKLKQRWGLSP